MIPGPYCHERRPAPLTPTIDEIARQLAQDEGNRRFSASCKAIGEGVEFSKLEREILVRRRNRRRSV